MPRRNWQGDWIDSWFEYSEGSGTELYFHIIHNWNPQRADKLIACQLHEDISE